MYPNYTDLIENQVSELSKMNNRNNDIEFKEKLEDFLKHDIKDLIEDVRCLYERFGDQVLNESEFD